MLRVTHIETRTVDEYLAASPAERRRYRFARHPFVLFGLVPMAYFVFAMRLPWYAPREWRCVRRSMLYTDAGLALLAASLVMLVGVRAFLLVQLPVSLVASTVGLWLFYIQHQFEGGYWVRRTDWDKQQAALYGSSHYALPRLLEWFTGSIGYHHVHHLHPRVPSYRLARCHRATSLFDGVPTLTLRDGWRCARLALWDGQSQRLVPLPRTAGAARETGVDLVVGAVPRYNGPARGE